MRSITIVKNSQDSVTSVLIIEEDSVIENLRFLKTYQKTVTKTIIKSEPFLLFYRKPKEEVTTQVTEKHNCILFENGISVYEVKSDIQDPNCFETFYNDYKILCKSVEESVIAVSQVIIKCVDKHKGRTIERYTLDSSENIKKANESLEKYFSKEILTIFLNQRKNEVEN